MSSRGLNLCTLAGYVAADPQVRHVERKTGGSIRVAHLTISVDRISSRKDSDSFTVDITLGEDSPAWRQLTHIQKGALIIATGAIDASPYVSTADSQPQAGLRLKANDIFLDSAPRAADPIAIAPPAQAPRALAGAEI